MVKKTKPIPLESTIIRSIAKRLRELDCWFHKFSPGPWGNSHELDFAVIRGTTGFILEVKRPAKSHVFDVETLCPHCWRECTPAQRTTIRRLRTQGIITHVVCSADEAEAIVSYSEARRRK